MLLKCAGAEFVGTFFLVFIGVGAVAVEATSGGLGSVGVSLAFTFAVATAVYAFGPISGAHINPAVTIGLWTRGALDLGHVPVYVVAQLAGAVTASFALVAVFGDAVESGATVPRIALGPAFLVEALMSFALLVVILAVVDHRGARGVGALAIGLAVGMDSLMGGGLTGASMNPARSFGPAVASSTWTQHWLYWVAPIVGMVAAAMFWRWIAGRFVAGAAVAFAGDANVDTGRDT